MARRKREKTAIVNSLADMVQWATAPQPGSGFIEFPGG